MGTGQPLPSSVRQEPAPKVVLNFGVLTAVFGPPKSEEEIESAQEQACADLMEMSSSGNYSLPPEPGAGREQESKDELFPIQGQELDAMNLWLESVLADDSSSDVARPIQDREKGQSDSWLEAILADDFSAETRQPNPERESALQERLSEAILAPEASSKVEPANREQETTPQNLWFDAYIDELRGFADAAIGKVLSPEAAPKPSCPDLRLVAIADPNSALAEKFRALATRLEVLREQSELKSLQVVSSAIHEGKSLVSGNVALTLAKHFGSRTLLIEGDLRRPTLAPLLGLENLGGLSRWWDAQDEDLDRYVQRLGKLPLWFLPAGMASDRPSDILRSPRFVKAFQKMAGQFDWIVVDSIPLSPIVDVNVWSRLVDGTLLVLREGMAPDKALQEGLRSLDPPKLVGVLLNEATAFDELKYAGEFYVSPKRRGRDEKKR
jgi:capsular exopolysaccharide synthesis family protein